MDSQNETKADQFPRVQSEELGEREYARKTTVRHVILTIGIFGPLLWSLVTLIDYYPVNVPKLFYGSSDLSMQKVYYVLRGETGSGAVVDIPAIELTDALYSRNWSMVDAVVANESFFLASLHPANALLVERVGGVEHLPAAARISDLLHAWGQIYNAKVPPGSDRRLKAIRLDAFMWPGQLYGNYSVYQRSWRVQL